MAKLATTHSLSDYPKLTIKQIKNQLSNDVQAVDVPYRANNPYFVQTIEISNTPCNYGGYRYWFICPNCSKRVGVLYCAGSFICRHCIGANYATQLMQPIDQLFVKVEKIRQRLKWQTGIAHGHGNRPKGMHKTTFNSLVSEHDSLVTAICGNYYQRLNKGAK